MASAGSRHPPIAAPLGDAVTERLELRRFRPEDLGLAEVCSLPQADNPASRRVCERIGMRLERAVVIPANEQRGAVEGLLYKLTRAEWLLPGR